jgi:ribosomal protein S11
MKRVSGTKKEEGRKEESMGSERGKRVELGSREGKDVTQKGNDPVRCRVTCTMNNTKVVRTWYDAEKGKRVNRVKTAGCRGYQNAKRGTVYAAQEVMAEVAKSYLAENRPNGIHVLRRGMGRGRAVVLNELAKGGRKILTVSDATKDAHNGCRRKKQRRV